MIHCHREFTSTHSKSTETQQIDIHNRWVKKWRSLASLVEIPGNPPLLTEEQNVPHGVLHRHMYMSSTTNSQRPLTVYTTA